MSKPALISVDWGTTSLRCALVAADGAILARSADGPGINPPPAEGFASTLTTAIAPWRYQHASLPILMSGMIGSRQGWAEVPYLPCPANAAALAEHLHRLDAGDLGDVFIVPGLAMLGTEQPPEVMRGEETQIIGALAKTTHAKGAAAQLFVLPGTHSKWATVTGTEITSFATYMTGDVFAALRHHTILGRLMPDAATSDDAAAFAQGVSAGAADGPPGALLNRLFATRTLGLFERLPTAGLASYLSGLLIGAEIAAATALVKPEVITIIGNAELSQRYRAAADQLGLPTTIAPADCAVRGHCIIARAAGLLKEPS
jgi:2-dehydro-3-deoxygalactonokinase